MTKETELKKYMKANSVTQAELAKILGATQSAISQMKRSGRNILIREHQNGHVEAIEIKILNRPAA